MTWFIRLAPKKFLWKFPLRKGAIFAGIIMFLINVICVIILAVEIAYYKECTNCTNLVMRNAYGFSINAIVYCIIIIFINLWFIWGVKTKKSSVVLSWVVISAMWWAQSLFLIFILLCMYVTDTSLGWMTAVASAIIAFMVFAYLILIGYGHWLEIRKTSHAEAIPVE